MVIYQSWKRGERMALPLSAVERIETVAFRDIEYAGGHAMLQYRGELLPLEYEGEEAPAASGETARATVLICLRATPRGVRRVGMVVRQVLDVSAGTVLVPDAAVYEGQLAMVKERVTAVHRGFTAGPVMWKEVA